MRGKSSNTFAMFISPYTEVLMLPPHISLNPPAIWPGFWTSDPCTHCAVFLATMGTRHITSTKSLLPQPLLVLSYAITLHESLLPLSALMTHLPHPCPPHFVLTRISKMCRRLTTIHLPQSHPALLIRGQQKTATFLRLHRIQPRPILLEEGSKLLRGIYPTRRLERRHRSLLLPQLYHLVVSSPLSTTQTSALLRMHQISDLHILFSFPKLSPQQSHHRPQTHP